MKSRQDRLGEAIGSGPADRAGEKLGSSLIPPYQHMIHRMNRKAPRPLKRDEEVDLLCERCRRVCKQPSYVRVESCPQFIALDDSEEQKGEEEA